MKLLLSAGLIFIGVGVSMVGDVFLKNSNAENLKMLALGFIFYGLGAFPVALSFKYIEFGVVFLIWQALTLITALIVGRILFGEIMTINKIVALVLISIAMILAYK